MANSAALMQPVRVGLKVSNQYLIPSLNWNLEPSSLKTEGTLSVFNRQHSDKVFDIFVSTSWHMLSERLGFYPLQFLPLRSQCSVAVGCCRECTVLSFLNLVCFLQSPGTETTWLFCTVYPDVPRNAVEATSPSLFFLSHFVSPIIMKRLLEKITYKHRIDWPRWFTISSLFFKLGYL